MRRPRLHRFGLVLTALVQLLLPTFASVADARAEAAAERGAYAHIESHSTKSCVPVHAGDCALCRVIGGAASAAHAPTVRVAVTRLIDAPLPRDERTAAGSWARSDPSQRAPPTA